MKQNKLSRNRESSIIINFKPYIIVFLFIIIGFLMKLVGEIVHEILGHGFFVMLFRGRIESVKISLLWPYELSWIKWSSNNGLSLNEIILIQGGGILMCLFISFLLQAFLFAFNKINWMISSILFWISFWCLINAAGYLIVGGLSPFGDIYQLVRLKVLNSYSAIFLGVVSFLFGFFLLSRILRGLLTPYLKKKTSLGVITFWLIIPIIVMLAILGQGFQFYLVPLSFVPVVLSIFLEKRIKEKKIVLYFS